MNKKKRKSKNYPCLKSAIRPVPHSSEVQVPLFSGFSLKDTDKSDDDIIHDAVPNEDASLNDTDYEGSSFEPKLFDQNEQLDS